MAPTNDDGEPIPVKPVGGKNSGIVQGADAANVDAQNDQDDAQDITPDPEESEIPDPEEIKPEPSEVKGKTPKEKTFFVLTHLSKSPYIDEVTKINIEVRH